LFELARSFGRIASDYDVARPEFAPEAELKRELLPLLGDTYRLKITTVLYWGRRG